ncbi:MAG: hypothetical protein V1725_03750 [archaeon]
MCILFVCNQNQDRSKTAEMLFKRQFSVKSAGLYNAHPVTEKQLSWADVVVVMEEAQRKELGKKYLALYLKKKYFR